MSEVVSRFTSRKFLAAIGAFVAMVVAKQYTEAAGIVGAYVLAEAHIDSRRVTSVARDVTAIADQVADAVDAHAPGVVVAAPAPANGVRVPAVE